ncbi:MAG TPA: DUF5675 family protein [Candidatus Acidoferrum sp.]
MFDRENPFSTFEPPQIPAYLLARGFQLVIDRKHSFAGGIVGELRVNGAFLCYTLELAWLGNEKNKSCVPPGEYRAHLRFDHKDKWRIELLAVPGNRQNVPMLGIIRSMFRVACLWARPTRATWGDMVLNSIAAYEKLKAAYREHPGPISVKFEGVLATPWGDYRRARGSFA